MAYVLSSWREYQDASPNNPDWLSVLELLSYSLFVGAAPACIYVSFFSFELPPFLYEKIYQVRCLSGHVPILPSASFVRRLTLPPPPPHSCSSSTSTPCTPYIFFCPMLFFKNFIPLYINLKSSLAFLTPTSHPFQLFFIRLSFLSPLLSSLLSFTANLYPLHLFIPLNQTHPRS